MKAYDIKSPSGKIIRVLAESYYHAIELARTKEQYVYNYIEYFRNNGRNKI